MITESRSVGRWISALDETGRLPASDHPPRNGAGHPATGRTAVDYDYSEQIGYLLRRTYQRHLAIFQTYACDPQITSVQFVTLCALRDRGPSSQTDLIHAIGIDQATIRGIIDRLRKRNLIDFSSDPADRRKVILRLTSNGEALLDRMIPCAKAITEATVTDLSVVERAAINLILRKMIGNE